MTAPVTPAEMRAARAYVTSKKIGNKQVDPRKFAAAAKEQDVGFHDLMRFIRTYAAGGAEQESFRQDIIQRSVDS